jgi:hypothetical protein
MYQKPSIKVDGVDLVAEVEMLKRLLLQAQKKEWQGLTDEEIMSLLPGAVRLPPGWSETVRAIEAKLKEKNG